MDTTIKLPHQDTPPSLDLDDIRKRNAAARHLLQEWLADASGYDEETWPLLQERLEAERIGARQKVIPWLDGSSTRCWGLGTSVTPPAESGLCAVVYGHP